MRPLDKRAAATNGVHVRQMAAQWNEFNGFAGAAAVANGDGAFSQSVDPGRLHRMKAEQQRAYARSQSSHSQSPPEQLGQQQQQRQRRVSRTGSRASGRRASTNGGGGAGSRPQSRSSSSQRTMSTAVSQRQAAAFGFAHSVRMCHRPELAPTDEEDEDGQCDLVQLPAAIFSQSVNFDSRRRAAAPASPYKHNPLVSLCSDAPAGDRNAGNSIRAALALRPPSATLWMNGEHFAFGAARDSFGGGGGKCGGELVGDLSQLPFVNRLKQAIKAAQRPRPALFKPVARPSYDNCVPDAYVAYIDEEHMDECLVNHYFDSLPVADSLALYQPGDTLLGFAESPAHSGDDWQPATHHWSISYARWLGGDEEHTPGWAPPPPPPALYVVPCATADDDDEELDCGDCDRTVDDDDREADDCTALPLFKPVAGPYSVSGGPSAHGALATGTLQNVLHMAYESAKLQQVQPVMVDYAMELGKVYVARARDLLGRDYVQQMLNNQWQWLVRFVPVRRERSAMPPVRNGANTLDAAFADDQPAAAPYLWHFLIVDLAIVVTRTSCDMREPIYPANSRVLSFGREAFGPCALNDQCALVEECSYSAPLRAAGCAALAADGAASRLAARPEQVAGAGYRAGSFVGHLRLCYGECDGAGARYTLTLVDLLREPRQPHIAR